MHSETVFEAIEPLIADELIDDILFQVKSGKEATIFCCSGGVRSRAELLAVKVYKAQRFRAFRDDSIYQAGRVILDRRSARAAAKRTRFGREVKASAWTNGEYETLQVLHRARARVPRPFGHSDGAVAMEWIGAADRPAPQLKDADLDHDQARLIFEQVIAEIELWLACNVVHGDLSAYNLLWDGQRLVAIDFPQASDPRSNPNAEWLLARDIQHVCQSFGRWGIESDPGGLTEDMWDRFLRGQL